MTHNPLPFPDNDELLPTSDAIVACLRQRGAALDAAREASLSSQHRVLGAIEAALLDLRASKHMQMARGVHEEEITELPVVRLYHCPTWSEGLFHLEPGAKTGWNATHVLLQGWKEKLFLRIVGPLQPTKVRIRIQTEQDSDATLQNLTRVEGRDVFAMKSLNGGGNFGTLWRIPRWHPEDVLGLGRIHMTLVVPHPRREGRWASVGTERLPDLVAPEFRYGFDRPVDEKTVGELCLAKAVHAYLMGDAAKFVRTLMWSRATFEAVTHGNVKDLFEHREDRNSCFLLDFRGQNPTSGRAVHRLPWRTLTRWEALWVRALVAEIQRTCRDAARVADWCADIAVKHPQVGRDSEFA